METEGRFRWELMGKADYSRCGAIIASLPKEVRTELNSSEQGVLTRILHLCWLHASSSGRGTAYCIPSESYLAKAIDRSVRTVKRCIRYLVDAGLITRQRRAPVRQTWLSNLYGLGKSLLAVLYAGAGKKAQQNQRGPLLAHNDLKKGIEAPDTDGSASLQLSEETVAPRASSSPLPVGGGETPREKTEKLVWQDRLEQSQQLLQQDAAWTQENYDRAVAQIAARKAAEAPQTIAEDPARRREHLRRQAESLKARGL